MGVGFPVDEFLYNILYQNVHQSFLSTSLWNLVWLLMHFRKDRAGASHRKEMMFTLNLYPSTTKPSCESCLYSSKKSIRKSFTGSVCFPQYSATKAGLKLLNFISIGQNCSLLHLYNGISSIFRCNLTE